MGGKVSIHCTRGDTNMTCLIKWGANYIHNDPDPVFAKQINAPNGYVFTRCTTEGNVTSKIDDDGATATIYGIPTGGCGGRGTVILHFQSSV